MVTFILLAVIPILVVVNDSVFFNNRENELFFLFLNSQTWPLFTVFFLFEMTSA